MPDNAEPMTPGLDALSESALRALYDERVARIAALQATEGGPSLAQAREIRALTDENNEIVARVAEFAPVAVAPLPPAAVIPVAPAPAVVVETPAVPAQTTTLTTFVEGQETELAEAIAAAAQVTNAVAQPLVSVRHESTAPSVRPAMVASAAASDGSSTGSPITLREVGEIVTRTAHNGQGSSNEPIFRLEVPQSVRVAGASVSPENGPAANSRALAQIITAEQADPALTAAPFTICGPADILRDVPQCDNVERYVQGWFRNIPSQHGQIQFYKGFGLADVVAGVGDWDQTDQAAVVDATVGTWKPCVAIGCLPTVTAGVEAVTQCMTMPVFQSMTSPEAVASAIYAMRAATARVADGKLLQQFDLLSSKYSFDSSVVGQFDRSANTQVFDALSRLLGATAAANRQIDLSGYTLAVEAGFLQHLYLDANMACNEHDQMMVARDFFGPLGLGRIVVTPDAAIGGSTPFAGYLPLNAAGNAAAAIPARPTAWKVRMFDPSDFAMLTANSETIGIVPDLSNKRQNKVTWFGELFEGLAKLGCKPSFSIDFVDLKANGVFSGCITPVVA